MILKCLSQIVVLCSLTIIATTTTAFFAKGAGSQRQGRDVTPIGDVGPQTEPWVYLWH